MMFRQALLKTLAAGSDLVGAERSSYEEPLARSVGDSGRLACFK